MADLEGGSTREFIPPPRHTAVFFACEKYRQSLPDLIYFVYFILCFMSGPTSMKSRTVLCYNINRLTFFFLLSSCLICSLEGRQ